MLTCQNTVGLQRIRWLEICDCVIAPILFIYALTILVKLLNRAKQHSHFEFHEHKVHLIVYALSLIISIPLIMLGIYFWMTDFEYFIVERWEYYVYFCSHILPTVVYILSRPDEDCFNCFNRQAPQTYSCFQYTRQEIRQRNMSDAELIEHFEV